MEPLHGRRLIQSIVENPTVFRYIESHVSLAHSDAKSLQLGSDFHGGQCGCTDLDFDFVERDGSDDVSSSLYLGGR